VTGILRQREALALATPQERTAATAPAVLVLAPTLEVLARTPPGDDVLGQLLPTAAHRELVPAGAYHVAAQLLAVEAGADDHPASARVHVGGGRWLTFRAARQAGSGGGEHDIAVTVEPTTSRQRLPLFARAHGLSARETDVLVRLAEGEDTGTVAARLFVSEYAVLDHLKSISAKTGLRSRHALLTAALG
jgi:DNA-binding CsgD family transcriptional regulator